MKEAMQKVIKEIQSNIKEMEKELDDPQKALSALNGIKYANEQIAECEEIIKQIKR